ncbi:MAG TPA: type II secretion system F family protein [Dehalococcoidia bacterium]|nr:type II secretion system F family protein [Dehalococcoidia bacterium]
MALLIAVMVSSSVFLVALWFTRSKNQMELRLRGLGEQQRMIVEEHDTFSQRVAFPFVNAVVTRFIDILPTSMIGRARRQLIVAGEKMSVSQFFTIVLIAATAIPAAFFVIALLATGGSLNKVVVIGPLVLIGLGLFIPFMVLRRVAKNRQKRIWRAMPNAIDLLTTCVEAGLSLDFALQRVADRYRGALSDEIQRMLREVALGKTRRDALKDMAERIEVPDLMTLVNSIIQAEVLGTSIGQVLRVQAAQLRMRRRQAAEQQARRAPAKMVFALVFLFIPSMFIVTIGPIGLNLMKVVSEH